MFNPHAHQVNIQLREPLEKGKHYGFSVKISSLFTFWKKAPARQGKGDPLRQAGGEVRVPTRVHITQLGGKPQRGGRLSSSKFHARNGELFAISGESLAVACKLFVPASRYCHYFLINDLIQRMAQHRDPVAFQDLSGFMDRASKP
jgi:hypothetical protein